MTTGSALLAAAIAIAVLMFGTWLLSLVLRNASIVDIVWGLGFVVVAWVVRLQGDTETSRQWLLVVLVTVWGLRLAGYLFWRNHGEPEDYRYRAMRNLRVLSSRGVGSARVVDDTVQMTQVRVDAQVCIAAEVQVLRQ
ncbi:MAG: DUF1295 domain-containing protein, partial [Ilumatobacteraceae bacterium]